MKNIILGSRLWAIGYRSKSPQSRAQSPKPRARGLFLLIVMVFALAFVSTASKAIRPPRASLQYLGHSCFLLTTTGGVRVVMDPHGGLGYPPPDVGADIVTASHEHFDHNNVEAIKGKPVVIRGLKPDGSWNEIDRTVNGVRIRTVGSYHDDEKGAKRGRNSIFIFDLADLKIVHCGDLGHLLDDDTAARIGRPDFLLVPVGGYFTIGATQAWKVIEQLDPKIVVPMHYKTPKSKDLPIQPVNTFIDGLDNVRRVNSTTAGLEPADRQEVWVLQIPQ